MECESIKISIITVCRNAVATIANTLESVAEQTYAHVEHIVVDGASSDGTTEVIRANDFRLEKWVSEPDNGIYDAMNKGLNMVTGDVVAFLNADDIYSGPDVLERVAGEFDRKALDACFGDIVFVRKDLRTTVRYYRSQGFTPRKLSYGWMPAHPSLFLKRSLFEKYGNFKTDYRIAADYELVVRLFGKQEIRYHYIPEVLVKMRTGGVSTRGFGSSLVLNREIVRACRDNGIETNLLKVFLKVPMKLMELFQRPS